MKGFILFSLYTFPFTSPMTLMLTLMRAHQLPHKEEE